MNPTELKPATEIHAEAIKRVFSVENLQGILAVIHELRPARTKKTRETEFETIVHAAKEDAYDEIMEGIAAFIVQNSNYKKPE